VTQDVDVPGRFITFEGGDGAGKSTQAAALEEWLVASGKRVVRTREPGGTELGVRIREIVLHERGHVDARAEALLYAADRAHHIATVVRPALEAGAVVIQDRYIDSSVAYQGVARGLGADRVRSISEWASDGLQPDLTVLLDLEVHAGRERLQVSRGGLDRLEAAGEAFHGAVRQAFLDMATSEPERFLVIDAAQAPATISAEIRRSVAPLVGLDEPAA
jgi:dTMP kinase